MKAYHHTLIWLAIFSGSITSCKKTEVTPIPLATVNVVNAVVNLPSVKLKFEPTDLPVYFSNITALAYGGNLIYSLNAERTLRYGIAISSDTSKMIAGGYYSLKTGGTYTLYLSGQTGALDTLLMEDQVPVSTDSIFSVRFINLSYNSQPISVNLVGATKGSEVNSLSYRQQSIFIAHQATLLATTYVFEIRNAATGNVLGTYSFLPANPVPRFKSCTLAWIGQTDVTSGTYMLKIQRINNY